jgi:hypothetical protein
MLLSVSQKLNIILKGGFNFDFIMLSEKGNIGGCMNYETREDPFDPKSPGVKVQLNRLTGIHLISNHFSVTRTDVR